MVRWGMIGCGDVAEAKSGPAFQKARGSCLAAVMRRDGARAEDYARRHGVLRVHATAADLIDDPGVDAVYVATLPDSHADLLVGPVEHATGVAVNTGGAYEVKDVTVAVFRLPGSLGGVGVWNFNAGEPSDSLVFTTDRGEIRTAVFLDTDIVVRTDGAQEVHQVRNPPHVHQPLIQTIVDELSGTGSCPSTGESGARASRVLEMCATSPAAERAAAVPEVS